MLAIREEARAIAEGRMDKENNPLKNAPHTVEDLVGEWNRPYSREAACFPAGAFRVDKYWPPVNRVDNVYGDRNLVCACAPMEPISRRRDRSLPAGRGHADGATELLEERNRAMSIFGSPPETRPHRHAPAPF
jgi:hypothetical protein